MKEIACVLLKIGQESNRSGYTMVDITVKELTIEDTYDITCFTHDIPFSYQIKDKLLIPLTIGKVWKGKQQYSCSLEKITLLDPTDNPGAPLKENIPQKEELPPEAVKEEVKDNGIMTKDDWGAKETRNFRGKAVMYALETVKMSLKDEVLKNMLVSDIHNMIVMEADQYLDYIYNGDKSIHETTEVKEKE